MNATNNPSFFSDDNVDAASRPSSDSLSSVSTTSLVFEHIHEQTEMQNQLRQSRIRSSRPHPRSLAIDNEKLYADSDSVLDDDPLKEVGSPSDLETGAFLPSSPRNNDADDNGAHQNPLKKEKHMDRRLRLTICIVVALGALAWISGLVVFLYNRPAHEAAKAQHDPDATRRPSGKEVTLDQVLNGFWRPNFHSISWIAGPNGEDGLLLSQGEPDKDYLVVEHVKAVEGDAVDNTPNIKLERDDNDASLVDGWADPKKSQTLMRESSFNYENRQLHPGRLWPSSDHKKVLIATDMQEVWRHSFTAIYWIFDVATQTAEPLEPKDPDARIQLATWSPTSDAVVYTKANNMYLRKVVGSDGKTPEPITITKDGGSEYFYGIPDWAYEEEVFGTNSATWWSSNGKFVAFLRTNESVVPEFPIDYFLSRPSGDTPPPGLEAYPDEHRIKYPKAGAPNPIVDLRFYDVEKGDVFSVNMSGGFADDDRLITNVLWTGENKVIIKESNRFSDIIHVLLIDVASRTGQTVRTTDVTKIDGGWFEISHKTTYVPASPENGRPHDGYVDTIIQDNGDHLAYFTPLDNPDPIILTSGPWEVDNGPTAVDLVNNLVYFIATRESSIQRHVYSVGLDGKDIKPVTDIEHESYYSISFSSKANFALLTYNGPSIPWQRIVATPSNPDPTYTRLIEDNADLGSKAARHELPLLNYGTIEVDGIHLNYLERRPPNFNPKRQYPVLFQQYSGPGSQTVTKQFSVNFQSYVASSLGYIVVTVDGRGTGFIGRSARVCVRDKLGEWEAHDQIVAARTWAAKPYVDASRLAIWGWSYGGFTTLKTLEQDAGQTFSYGMAVAPVTDWRFYDSIYTERYMHSPQTNAAGYDSAAISNVSALADNVRFLVMHGLADDNVHFQNTRVLLDKLDLQGVENYDVHVFPDSNHGIYFHNANRIVFDKLSNWLVNAFNGEWLHVNNAKPKAETAELLPRNEGGV